MYPRYCCDPPCGIGEVLHFLQSQRTPKYTTLAVREPFLDDLVAAELVAPHGFGDVAPVGVGVEVDIEGRLSQRRQSIPQGGAFIRGIGAFDGVALAGHDGAARADVAPTGGQREVVARHVAPVRGGGNGDGGHLRAERAHRDAGNRGSGVEQGGEHAAPFGRAGERVGIAAIRPAGERDARPFHAQRTRVGHAVGGIVESGKDVMEQILDAQAEAFEVTARRGGEVGAMTRVFAVGTEPSGEEIRHAVPEVVGHMTDQRTPREFVTRLAFSCFDPHVSFKYMRLVIRARRVEKAGFRFPIEPANIERTVYKADESIFVLLAMYKQSVAHCTRIEFRRRSHCKRITLRNFLVAQARIEIVTDTRFQPIQVGIDEESVAVGFDRGKGSRE